MYLGRTPSSDTALLGLVSNCRLCRQRVALIKITMVLAIFTHQSYWTSLQVAGFVGSSCPEAVLNAVRARFEAEAHPRGLGLIIAASSGNSRGRGTDVLAVEGLVE